MTWQARLGLAALLAVAVVVAIIELAEPGCRAGWLLVGDVAADSSDWLNLRCVQVLDGTIVTEYPQLWR